ncbi:MAG: tetratricopeptide repeat protein [Candidatus Omnitrophota bacterium]|nr:MAG: tetratricopeptide repeat protein [Candidatus Omnitrophota bacterium]
MDKKIEQLKEYADLCEDIGIEYFQRGNHDDAELLFHAALELANECNVEDNDFLVTKLNNLATVYFVQNRYEEAELLYRRGLRLFIDHLGFDHHDLPRLLQNFSKLSRAMDQETVADGLMICAEILSLDRSPIGKYVNHTTAPKGLTSIIDLLNARDTKRRNLPAMDDNLLSDVEIADEVCVA